MKWPQLYIAIAFLFLLSSPCFSQQKRDYRLMLRSGAFTPLKNIGNGPGATLRSSSALVGHKSFVIIQFEEIPGQEERDRLRAEGIELLEYIPNNAFTATITGSGSQNALARTKGRAIVELTPEQKMHAGLVHGNIPTYAIKTPGTVQVWISYPRSFTPEEIKAELKTNGFEIVSDQLSAYQILELQVAADKLKDLAGLPFIQYVQPKPQDDKGFNNKTFTNSRANVLASTLPAGRGLTGKGVVVGIGDEANPLQHIDFNSRIINRNPMEAGAHGVHVMGTMAGAGLMNERFAGYAPKATIVVQSYSNILAFSPQYVRDFGMVVTNNSYGGDVNTCATFGIYDLYSYILDRQAFDLPYLQHVFAAGNSGLKTCGPLPAGFGNLLGGYQTSKNVISVGNTSEVGVIANGSSRGPVRDGRIKPELVAQGSGVMSTIPVNLYGNGNGSSMSSPAVAGGLALLTERYRQLHNNQNPKNALLKALVTNGAVDKGNEGPDYKYGFGWLNLLRSLKMLESESFVNDSLEHNATKDFTIEVPSNTAQLKVMLYWNDPAAAVLSEQNLVHNLDLKVVKGGKTTLPRLLDPTPAGVNNVATTGVDNTNNIEQVTMSDPTEGAYTISVKGTSVAQNPRQEYVVVYDIIPNSLTLTYPIGNESLKDGDAIYIHWDAFGNTASTFTVEYSVNNGGAWTTIGNNLAAATRQFLWTIPAGVRTDQAKVRVTQNSTGVQSTSEAFTILGIPTLTLANLQCEGYIALGWTAVPGATDYEVMILKGSEMVSAGFTASTSYTFSGMRKDSTHVVTVRARMNGHAGRRAVAISRKPDSGTCSGAISDHDLKIESILTPTGSGRQHTSSQLNNPVFVKIRIKNLDDTDSNAPFEVGYELNGTQIPLETITPFIEKGKTYDHTFSVGADLAGAADYTFKVYIHSVSDHVSANDTLVKTFRQLPNEPLSLPFLDNMENLPVQTVVTNQTGLAGDGRYDFSADTDAGRIRTFVNSGFARSGQRALTLDANRYYTGGNTNFLEGTFNLSSYDIDVHDVRLNFSYKNHGQKTNTNNKVWVRGNDTDPWIEAYDLFANQNLAQNGYKTSPGIEVSNLLAANGKNLSSSFQVRFGQWGKSITADYVSGAGYSFDDIEIYTVTDDIQVLAMVAPAAESCGLGNAEDITVKIRNSSAGALTNVPVFYQLNNGEIVSEVIPSIDKRTTIDFTFSQKAGLSALGNQTVKVWSAFETDSYRENDTTLLAFYNAPLISTFPYLENFEGGDGYWSPKGINSSWQYGSPVSAVVNSAASGSKIWKTNLSGTHNDKEESYLYSPCFQVGGLASPMLSFSVILDFEVCDPNPCDYVSLEYSGNGGAWTRLGSPGQGTNWYNKTYSSKGAWSIQDYIRWHVASIPLPTGFQDLKIRFVMVSDGFTHREGIALDDIHIFDKASNIYDEGALASPIVKTVNGGNDWIHFTQNGKLVASVNPNGQNLGSTAVQTYLHSGAVRSANLQYYLNRNFTVKPANISTADFVTVRMYFLETEVEALLAATGCNSCGKPANAFELGISKYRGADKSKEDGSLVNSTELGWSFHPASELAIVPYDNGYYVEMKMKAFSEFWLAKNFIGNSSPLPVDLIRFEARKKTGMEAGNDVILEWETAAEENFERFDIEVANGNDAYRKGLFVKIGGVTGGGRLTGGRYAFLDQEPMKSGARYYRLKMVDADSTFSYSMVRPVVFDEKTEWTTYPNPSAGVFYVVYRGDPSQSVLLNIYDLNGRLVKQSNAKATGFLQKEEIDLSSHALPKGLYMLEVANGKDKQTFKLLKE
ncbi:S8 family serine peptidase [Dyadobacter aurulentus]|uniref:S8 family serine peptidase n=1 Tax=Dyadobacter sp. UC 10 TaxID=2605428 RepID=UPI0011F406BF|nr:S8 family serine peptidase [Dyadobacter sp. UC 10]KAA0991024.1 S8 family serine peptidase [Dyadobacter sp. UC 10]